MLLSSVPVATENHFVQGGGSLTQAHFGATCTCLQIAMNSEKENPHILAFLTLEQTSNTGEQGELFIVHFTSEADESGVSVYLRALCSLLSDLVTALVKARKGQSRILPSQQILAGSSGEE